jgi:hypothetical protein
MLAVRHVEEHVGVAWHVERTPTREVVPGEFADDVRAGERELPAGEGSGVALDRLGPGCGLVDLERVAPLRRPGHDDRRRRLPPASPAAQLNPSRHASGLPGVSYGEAVRELMVPIFRVADGEAAAAW